MLNSFKAHYKKRNFLKNATCGSNLTVSADSSCQSSNKSNIQIGNSCDICGNLIVSKNGKIHIGNYTTIRYNSIISAANNITIGNYVIISNNVNIYDHNSHPTDPETRIEMCKSGFYSNLWSIELAANSSVTICDNVWIGERSTILKGVTIGEGSIVATCSVITKDVPPYVVVAGNPAVVVKQLRPKQ